MPRHKFSDAQIAMVVREIENGARAQEVNRKLGVTENTLYNWKREYAGMGSTEIRRLRQLEEDDSRLKNELTTAP